MHRSFLRFVKLAILGCLLIPLVAIVCSRLLTGGLGTGFYVKTSLFGAVALAIFVALWLLLRRLDGPLEQMARQQADFLDALPSKYVDLAIFVSAAASLFVELAMIRWQGTVFEFFAFYKNLGLLCAFAGLGLGYALANRSHIPLVFTVPLLAIQMLLMIGMRYGLDISYTQSLMVTPFPEQLNMGYNVATSIYHYVAVYSFISVIFIITALAFIPIGQLCGRLMKRRENLRAYSWNLLGSLTGVLLIFAASYLRTGPVVWFAVSFAAVLAFQSHQSRGLLWGGAFSLVALAVLAFPVSTDWLKIYSPYQLIERGPGRNGQVCLKAAGHYYQRILDLSKAKVDASNDEKDKFAALYYEFPYKVFGKGATIAIVGSGTGNDVAAALRRDAKHVDAIEIDPVIMETGAKFHPEKPYSDERVRKIVNDARSHLRTTGETYDMVVYGLLDSHTLLSHASSVRLDSFVYTVEGLKEAKDRLKDGGVVSLSFCVMTPELGRKIYKMMEDAFDGRPPICVRAGYDMSVIFFQAKDRDMKIPKQLLEKSGFEDCTAEYADPKLQADVSTDDWPFFYMPRRIYPMSYVFMMGLIVALSVVLMGNFLGQRPRVSHFAFFLLGAGFMLVETKGITELGLTFGNTWHVIGIVIMGILLMGFLANCLVRCTSIRKPWIPYAILIGTLAAGYFVSYAGGFPSTTWGRIATAALLTCPLFASGLVFSSLLRSGVDIPGVMAMNLLGAMFGGILEYNSMYFGFRFLYLLAIGLYVLAMLSSLLVPIKGPAALVGSAEG